ncbi:MAG: peptide chain release factor N(5)-glutamine methyltransferase [Candidatus Omnitrophota bacterium]|nr:MAG: peptide chain release factor N(5)-glutamine methyltransferase [Candidatus Omnitrophota bacterium]
MKLKDWLKDNQSLFIDRDLRYLFKNTFGQSPALLLEQEEFLAQEKLDYLEELKSDYAKGVPLPYLLGKEEFLGWEFKVNRNVLIPRKETELVVEKALEVIKKNRARFVLDLGTGSGNIGISIKKACDLEVSVFSSDISFEALCVARQNVVHHDVKVELVRADLFKAFKKNSFDLIVANPPYVAPQDIKGSLVYEPREALEASCCGFAVIREILKNAPSCLKKGGYLIIEIGYNHKEMLESALKELGVYSIEDWIKDYSGYYRGIVLHLNESYG